MTPRLEMFPNDFGLIQGTTSTVYGISMTLIAYATNQLDETPIWPVLNERSYNLTDIDR